MKSDNDIKFFIENSFEPLALDFLSKFDHLVDGYPNFPQFVVYHLEESKIYGIPISCEIREFENYSEMVSLLQEIGSDNYVFVNYIKPFQIRVGKIESSYNLINVDRKQRIRDIKLKDLLDE